MPNCRDAHLATVSFVDGYGFAKTVGAEGAGVLVSQVVPPPEDAQFQISRRYRDSAAQFGKGGGISFQSLEGYVTGLAVGHLLEGLDEPLTRDSFLARCAERRAPLDSGGTEPAVRGPPCAGIQCCVRHRAEVGWNLLRGGVR